MLVTILDHLPNAHPRYCGSLHRSFSFFETKTFIWILLSMQAILIHSESILSIVPGIDGGASEPVETETLIGSIMHKGASIKLCPKGEMTGR